jgi:hypothetical protein
MMAQVEFVREMVVLAEIFIFYLMVAFTFAQCFTVFLYTLI